LPFDLEEYRRRAERFSEDLAREYYLHLAGHKPELEIEPVYERHASLFARDAVASLRELSDRTPEGDERRRVRYLLQFGFDGLLGSETREEEVRLAGLEASLEVEAGGGALPFRQVQVEQANEPDPVRRAALEEARDGVLAERLNPLHRAALERSHELCREFGWRSYAVAYAQAQFLDATDADYHAVVDRSLRRADVPSLGELRRSDLPRFFHAAELAPLFPADRLVRSLAETLAGLGLDLGRQGNIHLDTEPRRTKSPRAFCSTPRVPGEVYLVIAPTGGHDDYEALFHEGGHAEHYANADSRLAFEFRHLGDNSVTESFAFLLEALVAEPEWLRRRLGLADPEPAVEHARAAKLVMLRRYAAKLAYELELHGESPSHDRGAARYAELLTAAVRIPWPEATWLADVDGGFYVACYLRAWALERSWSAALRERFGELWFERAESGDWLRGLWRNGQRLEAGELLAETVGGELDFGVLAASFRA
jgi:hypothetical protein